MKKITSTIVALFALSTLARAYTLTGNIVDKQGNGIDSILLNTNRTKDVALTDKKGYFSIDGIEAEDTLVFKKSATKIVKIPINGMKKTKIILEEKVEIEEFVNEKLDIIFQNLENRESTVSADVFTNDRLLATKETNLEEALLKLSSSLTRNKNGKLAISETLSATEEENPLFVVNGEPISSIKDIAINTVKIVEILKDPTSCAIYGEKGTYGVILINLK